MKKFKKGFTLIELLVVIAIIGILAAMILVALNTARSKAKDARIKSDLGQLAVNATAFGDGGNGSYATWCSDGAIAGSHKVLLDDIKAQFAQTVPVSDTAAAYATTAPGCVGTATAWGVQALTNVAAETLCTDSTGVTYKGSTLSAAGVCSGTVL